ncbi:hypothetical protein [Ferrimonas marina]|uniref:Uncharacterized protein n=1 Tax=Ferrimonas marina TaxID=299255 RepID=A0A1M5Z5A0_9GAMM|nr:hypothetical protein [Ferrimonas marina]SHI19389.1 hypothetical protein SAMN02745129_4669 [Ferrimonas marina]
MSFNYFIIILLLAIGLSGCGGGGDDSPQKTTPPTTQVPPPTDSDDDDNEEDGSETEGGDQEAGEGDNTGDGGDSGDGTDSGDQETPEPDGHRSGFITYTSTTLHNYRAVGLVDPYLDSSTAAQTRNVDYPYHTYMVGITEDNTVEPIEFDFEFSIDGVEQQLSSECADIAPPIATEIRSLGNDWLFFFLDAVTEVIDCYTVHEVVVMVSHPEKGMYYFKPNISESERFHIDYDQIDRPGSVYNDGDYPIIRGSIYGNEATRHFAAELLLPDDEGEVPTLRYLAPTNAPGVLLGDVYFANYDGSYRAIEVATGKILRTYQNWQAMKIERPYIYQGHVWTYSYGAMDGSTNELGLVRLSSVEGEDLVFQALPEYYRDDSPHAQKVRVGSGIAYIDEDKSLLLTNQCLVWNQAEGSYISMRPIEVVDDMLTDHRYHKGSVIDGTAYCTAEGHAVRLEWTDYLWAGSYTLGDAEFGYVWSEIVKPSLASSFELHPPYITYMSDGETVYDKILTTVDLRDGTVSDETHIHNGFPIIEFTLLEK